MMTPGENSNLDVIAEKLTSLKTDMDEVKAAIKGLDTRLYTLEINDANYRAGFDSRLAEACRHLGEHDGVATESRIDRKEIRDHIATHNTRIAKLEWNMALLWVSAGLIVGTGATALIGGIVGKLLGWF
jgi:hypothetical protein